MEFLQQLFPVILYFLLCILVVVFIILIIKLIQVLKNVNVLLEDIEGKSQKLNGVFDAVDKVSTSVSGLGDKIVKFASTKLTKYFKKKKKPSDEFISPNRK